MRIQTLVRFLFGDRDAILRISNSRYALPLSLLLVLSAGFAREYDGEDLRSEPWYLLIPLGASLALSFILYSLIEGIARCQRKRNLFWRGYGIFLPLFWMTAPLAWLYAIPVERFLSTADSVRANLWLLGIVSVWRVTLITRVISVLYRTHWFATFFVVMLFGDALMWIVLEMTPLPILSIMGGIRLTESERILLDTATMLRVLCILSAPVWLIGTLFICVRRPREPLAWERDAVNAESRLSVAKPLWALSSVALLVWAAILPMTQPQQANRRKVETSLAENQIADALTFMSQCGPEDFPPHWDPPPRIGYGEATPDIWDVLAATKNVDVALWVRSIYIEKILAQSHTATYVQHRTINLYEMEQASLNLYVELLNEVGSGQKIAEAHVYEIERIIGNTKDPEFPVPISDERRTSLEEILSLARSSEVTESPEPAPTDAPADPSLP
ncbi:MAG: hypothetical protein QGG71_07340 [Pirellulaceae bacterium]|jgi:hypothetical protein|nr:hypothetical protein [Pirellulaceae bacterium]